MSLTLEHSVVRPLSLPTVENLLKTRLFLVLPEIASLPRLQQPIGMDAVRKSRRHSCPTTKSSLARLVSQTKLVRVVVGAYQSQIRGHRKYPKDISFPHV